MKRYIKLSDASDVGITLYRVGPIDYMVSSPVGIFFTPDLSYLDGNPNLGPDYSHTKAKKYKLLPTARVWDPAKEFEYYSPDSWSSILCKASDLQRFNIDDECDYEGLNDDYGITSTDGLAFAGKKLGYDATLIREVPWDSSTYYHTRYDEYAVYNPAVIKPL